MNKLFTVAVIFSLIPLQALISYTDNLESSHENYATCMTEDVVEPCKSHSLFAQCRNALAVSILDARQEVATKTEQVTKTTKPTVVKKKKATKKRARRSSKKTIASSTLLTSHTKENTQEPITYGSAKTVSSSQTYGYVDAYQQDPYPHNTATYASTASNDALTYGSSRYTTADNYLADSYSAYKPSIAGYGYRSKLADVTKHRKYLSKKYRNIISEYDRNLVLEDAGDLFEDALLNHIMPEWYGTPWNFYGHTNTPNQGTIACGYLVSTTLKHLGVNVNRYTLAQQWPINMVQSLVAYHQIGHAYDKYGAMDEIRRKGYGIYIIGLDNHVGFIKYDEWGMNFIHSNYDNASKYVVSENPEYSKAFSNTKNYYIGALSNNKEFLAKWLKYNRFRVVKG